MNSCVFISSIRAGMRAPRHIAPDRLGVALRISRGAPHRNHAAVTISPGAIEPPPSLGAGWVAPKGPSHVTTLGDLLEDELGSSIPPAARTMFRAMLDLLEELNDRIVDLDKEIARRAREDVIARRLMTIPGVGPITATAIAALAPPAETFAKGRDFAAWLGLAPRQLSTGGKQKLGSISKMGERTLRRLLIIGCSAVVLQASKRGAPKGSWLEQMLARKPRMLVTVALANKTARIVWALLVRQEDYKAPVAAAA